ncbi:hypothetical protein BDP27DRAFT_1373345 [Rhodocollybia butyracea]|uniref:Uncharacterized protein n=1 Tax=Rhodocollybia butyracea TaxID=206335 RepID=A0A9P5P6P6_9AGAR|nr:hypothetical protein BDP27DRAFT_1373345 [Rhodocollybia butyracea]
MPTFTYDVPLNAVGTTVSEQEFQDILRHPLPSSQQTFSPKLESWVPILSEVKCADINSYGSELSGAFTGHREDALPIFDKDQGKALDSSRESFAIVRNHSYDYLSELQSRRRLIAICPVPAPLLSVSTPPTIIMVAAKSLNSSSGPSGSCTAEHWGTPPPDRPSHIENNTLFVLVNPDIEADIRARRPPELESLQEWQIIEYGDVQIINGERMALSLDGTSGLEPRWILDQSLKKKGYKRAPGKRT